LSLDFAPIGENLLGPIPTTINEIIFYFGKTTNIFVHSPQLLIATFIVDMVTRGHFNYNLISVQISNDGRSNMSMI